MQPVFSASTFIFFIAVVLCFMAGAILMVFSKSNAVNNRWLAAYYLVIGYGLLVAFLLYSRLITAFPWYHTYRTGYISAFLLMPFSFFYIRSLIQQKRFRPVDLLHFLPAIVFIIDFIPFYFQPAAYKLQQLAVDAPQLNTAWGQFSQGWLGIGVIYVPLRIVLTTVYWIFEWRLIFSSGKLADGSSLIAENKQIMVWAKIFCGLQVLFFLPYYLNAVLGDQDNFFFAVHTLLAVSVSITIAALIMRPDILYGLKGVVISNPGPHTAGHQSSHPVVITGTVDKVLEEIPSVPANMIIHTMQEDNRPGGIYLSGQKLTSLGERLTEHIIRERSYLKKGCTSADLAKEINMQPYVLSAVINQVFKTNFNDFLNSYRVSHARTLIQNGEARLLTLEALSEQCGFNNRNSFTIAFKKHTGHTPSDFIKQSSVAGN